MSTHPTPLRYVTTPDGPRGLHRIVRTDGTPLRATPPYQMGADAAASVPLADEGPLRLDVAALLDRPRSPVRQPPRVVDEGTAPTGTQLAAWRAERGLSQRDLAYRTGLSRGLVAEIERGRRRHVLTRLRMAWALRNPQDEQGTGG